MNLFSKVIISAGVVLMCCALLSLLFPNSNRLVAACKWLSVFALFAGAVLTLFAVWCS